MKRSFVLSFSGIGMDQVKRWADQSPQILTWRYEMSQTIFLITENTAQELANDFEKTLGLSPRYIITEYSPDVNNCQGLLTTEGWYLLQNKRHKPGPK